MLACCPVLVTIIWPIICCCLSLRLKNLFCVNIPAPDCRVWCLECSRVVCGGGGGGGGGGWGDSVTFWTLSVTWCHTGRTRGGCWAPPANGRPRPGPGDQSQAASGPGLGCSRGWGLVVDCSSFRRSRLVQLTWHSVTLHPDVGDTQGGAGGTLKWSVNSDWDWGQTAPVSQFRLSWPILQNVKFGLNSM